VNTALRRVVLASGNAGKLRELLALLAPLHIDVLLQSALGIESPEETGHTFEANALLKARHAAAVSGLPALADDSGLEVDALDGRPGVRSARYAGEGASDAQNNAKLLGELAGVDDACRTAAYRCVIALVRSADDPSPLLADGSWTGCIATAEKGAGGFGYDPLFIPDAMTLEGAPNTAGITVAQMDAAAKNAVSHRARALHALLAHLR
jgi:XTP/dITP diphosphohydrolase